MVDRPLPKALASRVFGSPAAALRCSIPHQAPVLSCGHGSFTVFKIRFLVVPVLVVPDSSSQINTRIPDTLVFRLQRGPKRIKRRCGYHSDVAIVPARPLRVIGRSPSTSVSLRPGMLGATLSAERIGFFAQKYWIRIWLTTIGTLVLYLFPASRAKLVITTTQVPIPAICCCQRSTPSFRCVILCIVYQDSQRNTTNFCSG